MKLYELMNTIKPALYIKVKSEGNVIYSGLACNLKPTEQLRNCDINFVDLTQTRKYLPVLEIDID